MLCDMFECSVLFLSFAESQTQYQTHLFLTSVDGHSLKPHILSIWADFTVLLVTLLKRPTADMLCRTRFCTIGKRCVRVCMWGGGGDCLALVLPSMRSLKIMLKHVVASLLTALASPVFVQLLVLF